MNKELDALREIAQKLERITNLTLIIGHEEIKTLLNAELDSAEKRKVYDLTDGIKSVREIAELTGVNISSISRWSQRWEKLGIIVESRKTEILGRRERLFDPAAYE